MRSPSPQNSPQPPRFEKPYKYGTGRKRRLQPSPNTHLLFSHQAQEASHKTLTKAVSAHVSGRLQCLRLGLRLVLLPRERAAGAAGGAELPPLLVLTAGACRTLHQGGRHSTWWLIYRWIRGRLGVVKRPIHRTCTRADGVERIRLPWALASLCALFCFFLVKLTSTGREKRPQE